MHDLTSTAGIVAIAAAAVAVVALCLSATLAVRLRRVRADQRAVLGDREQDLVAHAAALQYQFEALHDYVEDAAAGSIQRMETAEHRLDGAISYRSLVRYDAYGEMSGRQSTSIALLDATRSGIVLSSIHHRDQARLYGKQVHDGRAELELSPEESEAIRLALEGGDRGPGPSGAQLSCAPDPRTASAVKVGYFGPEGTFTHEAVIEATGRAPAGALEAVPFATIYDTVMAVHDGAVERALVPIENSLEGSVNATLDALAIESRTSRSWCIR